MSKKKTLGRLAFVMHSWLGLISGIFLLLIGLSGSALVFLDEIDHALNAKLLTVQPAAQRLSLDSLYRKIGKVKPNLAGIAWLNPDAAATEAYEFRLYQNDGKISTYDLGLISINPYSGEILRQGNLKDLNSGIMPWITQFHWSLQMGIPGLLLATIFGITMLLSTITGFIIYHKQVWKVLTFRARLKWNNWRTISSGLHRVIGVWALVFNVVIFFTGFWLNKFSFDPAYWKKQTVSAPANTLATENIDKMLADAKKEMPELVVKRVYLPTQPGKDFQISGMMPGQSPFFYNGNAVSVNPHSGAITTITRMAEKGFLERAEATFFPLHVGNFGGNPIKILYVIIGLMPGMLSVTGALLWFRRRKKHI